MQSYDGFSHGGNICVFFTCYPCDKRVKMRQMGKKALKIVTKEVLDTLNAGAEKQLWIKTSTRKAEVFYAMITPFRFLFL